MKRTEEKNAIAPKNRSFNPNGRPPRELCFTDILRKELTKRKKFRRPDGSIMEASELELIALKVVQELRCSIPVNNKLLDIVLNRIEGKPKEHVQLDGHMEVAGGLDARDVLLQRLGRLISAREVEEDDSEAES